MEQTQVKIAVTIHPFGTTALKDLPVAAQPKAPSIPMGPMGLLYSFPSGTSQIRPISLTNDVRVI
jgi:hypothetical protein